MFRLEILLDGVLNREAVSENISDGLFRLEALLEGVLDREVVSDKISDGMFRLEALLDGVFTLNHVFDGVCHLPRANRSFGLLLESSPSERV